MLVRRLILMVKSLRVSWLIKLKPRRVILKQRNLKLHQRKRLWFQRQPSWRPRSKPTPKLSSQSRQRLKRQLRKLPLTSNREKNWNKLWKLFQPQRKLRFRLRLMKFPPKLQQTNKILSPTQQRENQQSQRKHLQELNWLTLVKVSRR